MIFYYFLSKFLLVNKVLNNYKGLIKKKSNNYKLLYKNNKDKQYFYKIEIIWQLQ